MIKSDGREKNPIIGIDFRRVKLRAKIFIFFIIIFGILYTGKLLYSIRADERKNKITNVEFKKINNQRANILDRNSLLISTSLPVQSIAINPQKIIDINKTIQDLETIFPDINKNNKFFKQLSTQKKFVWVKRNITPKQEKKLNIIGVPGLLFEKDYVRVYPYNNSTSFITGYVDVDQNGISGVEKTFNSFLRNNPNEKLELTIDIRLQSAVEEILKQHIDETNSDGGLVIVADITNGEILSLSSMPNFNPHDPQKAKPEELFNRANLGIYELGSVFKPITIASAIDSHSINLTELFDSMPPLKIGKYSINDFVTSRERMINAETILVKSSNIGTARIALKMGMGKQREYIEKFGLFKTIDVGLYEKGYPIWPKTWSEINAVTISYGHGFAITPMHLVQAMSSIINNGLKCNLHINKIKAQHCEQIINIKTSQIMRRLLREVVVRGSGKKAEMKNYCLGGKTGTSSKIHNGRYVKNESIASFVGIFPMYDPKYIMFISIDNPKGGKFDTTGGAVSAPIARDIIEKMIPIFNLLPEEEKCYFE